MKINSGTIKSITSVTLAVVLTLSLTAPALIGTALATDPNEIDTTTEFANAYSSNNVDGASVASPGAVIQPGGYMRLSATADDNITVAMGNVSDSSDVEVEFRENDDNLLGADTVSSGTADFEPGQDTVETVIIRNKLDRGISVDKIITDGGESSSSDGSDDDRSIVNTAGDGECQLSDAADVGLSLTLEEVYYDAEQSINDCVGTSNKAQAVDAAEDAQTENDLRQQYGSIKQSEDNLDAVRKNYQNDSRTIAFAKGQRAAINAMDAGSSESQTQTEARRAVEDYYSQQQINYLRRYEAHSVQVAALVNRSNVEGLNYVPTAGKDIIEETGTLTIKLLNGTNIKVETMVVAGSQDGSSGDRTHIMPFNYGASGVDFPSFVVSHEYPANGRGPITVPATSDTTSVDLYPPEEHSRIFEDFNTLSAQVKDNTDVWVNNSYDDFQTGNLTLSNYVSPLTLAQEYSTDYSETGYLYYAVSSLAAQGFDVPDLNSTASMTIETASGDRYTGLIASSSSPPNGEWMVGKYYNPDLIDGAQFFVVATGDANSSSIITLEDTFQIIDMENNDGDSIDSTSNQKYVYQTQNTSEYRELLKDISRAQTEVEKSEPVPGGGGGGGGGFDFGGFDGLGGLIPGLGGTATLILIGAVVALLLSNN